MSSDPNRLPESHPSKKLPIPDLPEVGHTLDYDDTARGEGSREPYGNNALPVGGIAGKVLKFKQITRVFWAEFFGTAILALFGTASNNQVALSNSTAVTSSPAGTYLTVAFGWALAVMLGVYVSAGISGGHINPAITLAMAIFRGFPWKKVPIYWAAQLTGSVSGAALVYWNYRTAIDLFEGGGGARTFKTGGLFFTNPLPYVSNALCFYNEFLMTAILMIFVVAVGDPGNTAPPKNLGPLVIFWVVFGLGGTLGMQTSFALNPARDLGPRLVTWFAGYGTGVWTTRSHYWFVVAILGPTCGAIVGAFIYDFFIATDHVSCALHGHNSLPGILAKMRAKRTRQEEVNGLESGQA